MTRPVAATSPGNEGLSVLLRKAVERLELEAAAVVRTHEGGVRAQILAGWPDAAAVTHPRAIRALDAVARGRRGLAIWRMGSRLHSDALTLWGPSPPARAGTVVVARLTPAGGPIMDQLVGVISAADTPHSALAQAVAELVGELRQSRSEPASAVRLPAGDPRAAALVESGIRFAGGSSLDDVLLQVLRSARRLLDAEYAAIGVLDPSGTGIERFMTAGIDDELRGRIGEPPTGRGVLGALLREPRTLRLERIDSDPRSCGFPPGHPQMTSFLGAPIALRGQVFGNIYLTDKRGGPFTGDDEVVLEVLAAQAAVAIDNTRRLEGEHLRVVELEQLQGTVRAVQEVLALGMREHRELDDQLPMVLSHVRSLGGADCACAALVEGDELVVHAVDPVEGHEELVGARTAALPEALAATLRAEAGRPVEVVALHVGGELVGVLGAAGEEISEDGARALMSAIGSQLALAVANRRAVDAERKRARVEAALDLARANERATAEGFRRAIQAQESERARIARELHDEAGQVLTAVSLHLRVLEETGLDEDHREMLKELRREVVGAATHLHELITDLRPAALREHGLAAAIAQQVLRLGGSTGIHTDVNVDALPDGLPEETQVAIFRVVQESLTNVARHSGAAGVSVTAGLEGSMLRVVVEDDGRGFDPDAETARHGLSGIRERVALLGGRLRVDSSPGHGAAVIVELELTPS